MENKAGLYIIGRDNAGYTEKIYKDGELISEKNIAIGIRPLIKEDFYKCKITSVGTVNDEGTLEGEWGFSGEGSPNAVGVEMKNDGSVLYGGYTVDELRRPKIFSVNTVKSLTVTVITVLNILMNRMQLRQ